MMDGMYTGVVDRIVDDQTAVFLLEEDGDTVAQQDVDVETLPPDGQHEGAMFEVRLEDGNLVDVGYQPEWEEARRERLREKFERLSKHLDEE